jgi:putative ABC transport system permease protein
MMIWKRWEQRMNRELQFHLDSMVEDFMQREGMSRQDAERRARREFGALDLAKEECRDEKPLPWLDHLWRDVLYALRSWRRNPGFAAAIIVTLALGAGANTAVLGLVYSALLRPLPYAEPDQIHSVQVVIPERRAQFASIPVSIQVLREWQGSVSNPEATITALRPWECNITADGEPERLGGARVGSNFFSFLGVAPALGRGFVATEGQAGHEKVVVISHALWRRRYGADPSVIGRAIHINSDPHTIVGVAAPGLLVPTGTILHPLVPFASAVDVWKPIAPTARELQGESWDHGVLIRTENGTTIEQARQQLEAVLNRYMHSQPIDLKTNLEVQTRPIREVYSGNIRTRLLLIFGAAGLLLLTACANIANLCLSRMTSRSTEFATRTALGASGGRLVSQVWVEITLLALAGGGLGAALAAAGRGMVANQGPDDLRLLAGLSSSAVPGVAVVFAVLVSLATGLVCGALPAWRIFRREDIRVSLGTLGLAPIRVRQVLAGVQMGLATALLASAALLLHSFVNVMAVDRGYHVERVLATSLSLFGPGNKAAVFYNQLADNVRGLPGVIAAGVINDLPAVAGSSGASRTIFDLSDTDFQKAVLQRPVAMIRSVTAGYFAASGTELLAGRLFASAENAPVALVSESLAKRMWPELSPVQVVGRSLRQGDVKAEPILVAGVVRNVLPGSADRELPPFIYRPYTQWASGSATLILRTSSQDPAGLAAAVRQEVWKLNPNLPVPSVRTMREIVSAAVSQRRFQMQLTAMFAVLALLIGVVGVYGVVSYHVASRTKEIGLRLALGAVPREVSGWILARGMGPVLVGMVGGLACAVLAAHLLRSLLFGISPLDPVALGAVVVLLLGASAAACYLPARRAARMDPMLALRHD